MSSIGMSVLDGTHPHYKAKAPDPPTSTNASTVERYEKELRRYEDTRTQFEAVQRKIYGYLIGSQKGELGLVHFQGVPLGDAAGCWANLRRLYESDSRASLLQQIRSLVQQRQGAQSVPQFLAKVCEDGQRIANTIAVHKLNLIEVLIIMVILLGLNDRYEQMRESLLLRDDIIEVPTLRTTLIEQCARVDAEHTSTPLVAHQAQAVPSGRRGGGSSSHRPPCIHCNGKHESDQCWTKFPHLREQAKTKKLQQKLQNSRKEVKALKASQQDIGGGSWSVLPAAKMVRISAPQAYRAATVPAVAEGCIRMNVDSGSTHHHVGDTYGVSNFVPSDGQLEVLLADGSKKTVVGKGDINGNLQDVHVVPGLSNLLSVRALYSEGKATLFSPQHGVIVLQDSDLSVSYDPSKVLLRAQLNEDLTFTTDIAVSTAKKSPSLPKQPRAAPVAFALASGAPMPASNSSKQGTIDAREKLTALAQLWHRRMCYVSPRTIMAGVKGKKIIGIKLPDNIPIEAFGAMESEAVHLGRSQAAPHRSRTDKRRSSRPFECVYLDVRVVNKDTYQLSRYALYIICDFTRFTWVYLLQRKDQVAPRLRQWAAQVAGSMGYKVAHIRCDNAGEQTSKKFNDVCTELEANPEYTNAYSSAANGIAERRIQTGSADADAIRAGAKLPEKAWGECVLAGVYVRNRLPSTVLPDNISPFQALHGKVPNVAHLRIIGSTGWVHQHKPTRMALDPRARQGVLLGYPTNTNGYRMLMNASTGEVVETQHVTFVERPTDRAITVHSMPGPDGEHVFYLDDEDVSLQGELVDNAPAILPPSEPPPQEIADVEDEDGRLLESILAPELQAEEEPADAASLRRSGRESRPVDRLNVGDHSKSSYNTSLFAAGMSADAVQLKAKQVRVIRQVQSMQALASKLPYKEAVKDPRLRLSMRKEIKELIDMGAIAVVPRPRDANVIGSTWAHRFKYGANGEYIRAKSRICPWGFQQSAGVDYDEDRVHAATLAIESAMLLLVLAVQRGMYQEQYDVDSAFATTENHNATTYMRAPPGIVLPAGHVLHLRNSLNGTKQGAFDFKDRADKVLRELGFEPCVIDPCLYRRWRNGKLTLLGMYVDDFRVAADDHDDIVELEAALKKSFPTGIKKPGAGFWLGMKLDEDRTTGIMRISQPAYIASLLEEYKMADCKPCATPAEPGSKLTRMTEQDPSCKDFDMAGLVGALLWLARTSRPDILYAVVQLCSHVKMWGAEHVVAAKRVLRYLHGSRQLELILRRSETADIELEIFADADFAGEPELNGETAMRSLTGVLAYVRNVGLIQAQSYIQATLSRSTSEAEYKASGAGGAVAMSFRQLLEELGFEQTSPTTLYNDNNAAIAMTKMQTCGSKMRHIKIAFHYIKELVRDKQLTLTYCPTTEMIADILTKALARPQFELLRAMLMGHARRP